MKSSRSRQSPFNRPDHFRVFREHAGLQLGINLAAVYREFKATAARWDERHLFDLLLEMRKQPARQTDGLRLVVSHGAVAKVNVHGDDS